jgi:hypothetical protein
MVVRISSSMEQIAFGDFAVYAGCRPMLSG